MKREHRQLRIILYILLTSIVITVFFPRELKFKYQFNEGKPWKYGLLTAPSNFPIFKSEEVIRQEQDSAAKAVKPYYRMNTDVGREYISMFKEEFSSGKHPKITKEYVGYVVKTLESLYEKGIISVQFFENFRLQQRSEVILLRGNIGQKHYTSDFFTIKSAYEFVLNNTPTSLDKDLLRNCNIDNYIRENVRSDKELTERMKREAIQKVSIANGMVQAGERIVDRGEIIDAETYNMLRSLKIVHEEKMGGRDNYWLMIGGQFIITLLILTSLWFFLNYYRNKLFRNERDVIFLLLNILFMVLITEISIHKNLFNIYIIPYALTPIVIRTFFDSRTAIYTHIIIIAICSLMVPFPQEFLLLQTAVGLVAIFSLRELSHRAQLIRSAFIIFLTYVLVYVCFALFQDSSLSKINWLFILYFGINFILLMFVYLLVYMLERAFGYTSDISLIELSDINTPLLRKLSVTAPGTFQHSLQVSILATEAAAQIKANVQLIRTGALYHDIGKMENPSFFTENQGSLNPHNNLPYDESARIIISHITDGIKIAEKEKLPSAVIDFIRTHHGKGKTKYFYNSFVNENPDKDVNEELFTYPGPNPFSKETGILMMADAVEASSRSLKEYTEEGITNLVNKIIDGILNDGLLRNTPLTFRDIERIKQCFIDKLKIIYHTRIVYPELIKQDEDSSEDKEDLPEGTVSLDQ